MAKATLVNARFGSNDQAMSYARERVIDAFEAHGYIGRITHTSDGTHVNGSSHYRNCAEDYGLVDIPEETRVAIVRDACEALNGCAIICGEREGNLYSDFVLIYGDDNHKQHFHLQWKPLTAMNR